MEWIDGVPLNRLAKLARGGERRPAEIAARIVMAASAGLHAAHELKRDGALVGLVHRDVSPPEYSVTGEGIAKVVDFGVARGDRTRRRRHRCRPGQGQDQLHVARTGPRRSHRPANRRVPRSATVLYALTTGKHPFRRDSEGATMMAICSEEPVVPPSHIVPSYPRALEAVVLKATAKDQKQRFASADELFRALDQLPSEIRASSDEDVGAYVRKLSGAGARRAQKTASSSPSSAAVKSARFARSRLPGRESLTGTSSPGSVSVMGTTASLNPGAGDELAARFPQHRRRRLAGCFRPRSRARGRRVAFALMNAREQAQAPSPVPTPSAAPVAAEPAPVSPALPEAPAAGVDVAPLPTASTSEASDKELKPAPAPHKKASSTSTKEQSPNTKATATKAVQKPPQWRNDPGF